jgi:outer membrane protein assembly factor BamE
MIRFALVLLLSTLALGACSLQPYKLNIQQGVVLDAEMIGHLKEGMTRAQVSFTLGTPLLTDPFHANRWDYVYYSRKDGKLEQPHNLTIFFKDDKLERFVSDYVAPEGAPQPAPLPAPVVKKSSWWWPW